MSSPSESVETAVESFLAARRRGEAVDRASFVARHAHLGPELSEALEALELLERFEPASLVAVPERVGPYRVLREVGRGGMGIVLEAVEEPLGRRVALKILPSELVASPAARGRFQREAALAARLDHSGIATVYGTGLEGDRPWIAMRFVDGITLSKAIATAREGGHSTARLPRAARDEDDAVLALTRCIAQVARALHAAHEQGVVHRDVKPSNVIVSPEGTPVLVDFGLAIPEESEGLTITRTGETAGTPAYIAPEIVAGSRSRPDAQVDVYALGVTLYECLALRRPFEGPTPVALYRSILSDAPSDVRLRNTRVPRDLSIVVATAIERDRSRRYASAAAFADDLEAVIEGRPIAARPLGFAERAVRWARREPRQALLTAGLVIASIAAASLAGNWWASRGEVLAAERVARDVEYETALTEGFAALHDDGDGARHFARARMSKPDGVEALAGLVLSAINVGADEDARRYLEEAPRTVGFDALRDLEAGREIEGDRALARSARGSDLDHFLTGVALIRSSTGRTKPEAEAMNRRALTMLDTAVERSPRAREFVHLLRAWATYGLRDEARSRAAAGSLSTLWPDSFNSIVVAGTCWIDWEPERALELLRRAHEMRPEDPVPLHELALLAFRQGELSDAEGIARTALKRAENAKTLVVLGNSLAIRGCADEARDVFLRAQTSSPTDEDALLNLAQNELQAKNADAGRFWAERLLQLDPWSREGHYVMSLALRDQGNREASEVHGEASVALSPDQAHVWAELVWLEGLLDRWEYARDCADAGLSYCPGAPRLIELRGRIAKILAKRKH